MAAPRWRRRPEGSARHYSEEGAPDCLPNDVRVTVEQSLPGNLSMDDWQTMKEVIEAVRQAIPDARNRPAGAVLEHVLSALKASDAKVLNCPKKD